MDLIQVVEMAMKDEKEAAEKYRQLARQSEDPETRLMFEQFSREEATHYKKLAERLKALKLMK